MKRPPQRAIPPPEPQPPFAPAQQRYPPPHPAAYPAGGQAPPYDERYSADYHYAGAPVRNHPQRHEYHPYHQRPPYSYYDAHFYPEIQNYWRPPYAVSAPGAEYTVPPNYMPRGTEYPYQSYYAEPRGREYTGPLNNSRYDGDPPSPYPPDPLRRPEYMPEMRRELQPTYVPPPRSHLTSSPPPHTRHRREALPAIYQSPKKDPAFHPGQSRISRYSSERQDINTTVNEARGTRSPHSGSRPGSDTSSIGSSTPLDGDAMPRRTLNGAGRNTEIQNGPHQGEHSEERRQSRVNSNLWQLVSVAAEEKH